MVYTLDLFKQWKSFDGWASLKSWLQSEEGGNLRVVDPSDGNYAIVRYVKEKSNFSLPHVGWCRSVVVDKTTLLPACVSPPRASTLDSDSAEKASVAEEFIDGTMINIFEEKNDFIHIATRSRIGASSKFTNGAPTFAEMLNEVFNVKGLKKHTDVLPEPIENKTRFVSLVLQHPQNRIVKHIFEPNFYIVHHGYVSNDGSVEIEERCLNAEFEIPKYSLDAVRGAKSVQSWVLERSKENGYGWQGLILKSGDGKRWRIRSQDYEMVKKFRGNESTPLERFARLRSKRIIDQYLDFYPEDREAIYEMEGTLRKNTRQLLQFYTDTFRTKKVAYHELPWPYKYHVSVLHNYFKDVLRAKGEKVDLAKVVQYVNNLPLEDLVNMSKIHSLELKKSDRPQQEQKQEESQSQEQPTNT